MRRSRLQAMAEATGAIAWLLLSFALSPAARAGERPNILLIVTDDQSPFDLRAYEPGSRL